jgi:uncharacterized protein
MVLSAKIDAARALLASFGSTLVAFSGGVDSSLILKLAVDSLGPSKVLAVTVKSETSIPREVESAIEIARICRANHEVITFSDLDIPEIAANPPDRCYYCKRRRFSHLKRLGADSGYNVVVDGSNWSDRGDYRPGMKAQKELGIRSPLMECGFTKEEVRQLAIAYSLPNWNKPSDACLASRFPYGTPITARGLSQVARGETLLEALGLKQFRLRHHGTIARIEIPREQFNLVLQQSDSLIAGIKDLGYIYVTLDLEGFRSGSLNEAIPG